MKTEEELEPTALANSGLVKVSDKDCPNCDTWLHSDWQYCPECGKKIVWDK